MTETYYRVMQVHDGYVIEYSYDKNLWHVCRHGVSAFGLYFNYIPYWYKTKFFAKRKLHYFIKRDAKEAKARQHRESFVPKVVYGPYP